MTADSSESSAFGRLQVAQVLRVRRGDVHHHVAGLVVDAVQACQVVVGGAFDRRVEVLADVDAEHAAERGALDVAHELAPRPRC
jgi:hypothetical protein